MTTAAEQACQRLHDAAQRAGLHCVATTWSGWHVPYTFVCGKGHRFTRFASNIVFHSVRCPECVNQERLARLQQAAQDKGGQCLESSYLGGATPHRFECADGHQWQARPSSITNGKRWCRQCAHAEHAQRMRRADGLAQLQRIAAEKGGACLSDVYTIGKSSYRFQCAQGHQWETVGDEVMRGAWCSACAIEAKRRNYRVVDGLARLQQRASEQGGECLAQAYVGAISRYRFRCKRGHEWETTGHRIMRGAWCVQCVHDNKKLGIELMRQIAHERGGACLSEQYVNSATKLQWECHRGHHWHAIPAAVRKGHWCPLCAIQNRIRNANSKARMKYQASPPRGQRS